MAERPPSMILIAFAALASVVALGAVVTILADESPLGSETTAAEAPAPAPPPAPTPPPDEDPSGLRLTMSPLPYVGELFILEEALADGRADFEPCWRRADGRDGTYRVKVRLESGLNDVSTGDVEVVPHPGVDPFVCISAMLEPRPGHDSLFDGSFTLTIRGGEETTGPDLF